MRYIFIHIVSAVTASASAPNNSNNFETVGTGLPDPKVFEMAPNNNYNNSYYRNGGGGGGYTNKQWHDWYNSGGNRNRATRNDHSSSGNGRRVWLNCNCGNSAPADRKFLDCNRCGFPWAYPDGCKHDPKNSVAKPATTDPLTPEQNSKIINDPKTKQFFEALAKHPDLREAAASFQNLLTMVVPSKKEEAAKADPAATAKALRDASAKVAAVKGRKHQNKIQIDSAQATMVELLKVERRLDLEETEATEALEKATADQKASDTAASRIQTEEAVFHEAVQEEMELNLDPEVMQMEEAIQAKRAWEQSYINCSRIHASKKSKGPDGQAQPPAPPAATSTPEELQRLAAAAAEASEVATRASKKFAEAQRIAASAATTAADAAAVVAGANSAPSGGVGPDGMQQG